MTALVRQAGITTIDHYGIGSGIGLSPTEAPQLSRNDGSMLTEGMCLTLRIAACDARVGAYMTGDTLLLVRNRATVLV